MLWDAGWNVTADSYRVFEGVGARVVCSLRRSSLDRAISKAIQLAFHSSCGVSNAVTPAERACLRRVQRQGQAIDGAISLMAIEPEQAVIRVPNTSSVSRLFANVRLRCQAYNTELVRTNGIPVAVW